MQKEARLYYENIPIAEVCNFLTIACEQKLQFDGTEECKKKFEAAIGVDNFVSIRFYLALNRLQNRICSSCCNKNVEKSSLIKCQKCHLTYYCNQNCLDQDQQTHSKWCMQLMSIDAIDQGPMQTTIMRVVDTSSDNSSN